ncbi:MAG: DUF2784 domain-containing protein, partial [Planctomycetes bacterium]|nr:DUF2784 domain-containing protein [Planctomycetota bacterium]
HWEWIRHPGFRWGHLTAITIVVIESVLGIPCPLTVWESELRLKAGEVAYRGDFVGYWTHRCMFYDFPPGVFTSVYVAFGLLVVASFWGAPPRRKSP